jgi:hypothetical protein
MGHYPILGRVACVTSIRIDADAFVSAGLATFPCRDGNVEPHRSLQPQTLKQHNDCVQSGTICELGLELPCTAHYPFLGPVARVR